jgi:MFS transporter, PAT family, beta-lactamase induction signal transducer AmpG
MNQRYRLILICIFLGFSSGLPLFALASLLPVWLKTYGVDLKSIGLMTTVMLPYAWKFLWAPILDRYELPFLGKRRGWILVTQIICLLCLGFIGYTDYQNLMSSVVPICIALAFASASQDIVLDAYRREYFSDEEQASAMAVWLAAYKISSLASFSLPLILVDKNYASWQYAWWICGLFMLIGIFTTLIIKEPEHNYKTPTLQQAIVEPFKEFFGRLGVKQVLLVLSFICLYKLGDMLATNLASVFYLEIGYTKTQIGTVAKIAGLAASIIGGIVGAVWMSRLGVYKSLWVFGILQAAAILGFIWLAYIPANNIYVLAVAIAGEALAVGMGSAAMGGYLATLTNRKYSATQFALFSSIAALPRTIVGGYVGYMQEFVGGWFNFFILCTFLAIPGMVLLYVIGRTSKDIKSI